MTSLYQTSKLVTWLFKNEVIHSHCSIQRLPDTKHFWNLMFHLQTSSSHRDSFSQLKTEMENRMFCSTSSPKFSQMQLYRYNCSPAPITKIQQSKAVPEDHKTQSPDQVSRYHDRDVALSSQCRSISSSKFKNKIRCDDAAIDFTMLVHLTVQSR